MRPSAFNDLLARLHEKETNVLVEKAAFYAKGNDRLSNFKKAGKLNNQHPAIAAYGMATKHLVAISDYMQDLAKGHDVPAAEWIEKITDARNYLALILACLQDGGEVDFS